jgi:hypothetical protein
MGQHVCQHHLNFSIIAYQIVPSAVLLLVSRFILNLRGNFTSTHENAAHSLHLSDMSEICFVTDLTRDMDSEELENIDGVCR